MDLSGLIFVALALAWAGYLIPRALRHDDLEAAAPVDTSSDTARVLHRTPAMMRVLLADAAPVDPERRAADKVALRRSEHQHRAALGRSLPAGAGGAAVRRRRMLLVLAALAVVCVLGATLSLLSWWSVVASGLLVATWLVLCVLMARKARFAARRRSAGRSRFELGATHEDAVPDEGDVPAVPPSPIVEQLVAEAQHDLGLEPGHAPQAAPVAAVAEESVALDAAEGALWDPLPLTLPTYVGKPAARRTVRTIELTGGAVTSSGHDAADSALARRAAAAATEAAAGAERRTDEGPEASARRAAGA